VKRSLRNLAGCDAGEAAASLAALLNGVSPNLQSGLLITGAEARPLRQILGKRIPAVDWLIQPPGAERNFPERHFDVAVTLDSPAALDPRQRKPLVRDLVRVCRHAALIAVPLGTDLQRAILQSLQKFYRECSGSDAPDLAEQLKHGLPNPAEAFSWVDAGESLDIFYGGDVVAFQQRAEHLIRLNHAGFPASYFLRLTEHLRPETLRVTLDLETVPMRRHRRLFLILKRD
jgi:hypothetical protein